MADLKLDGLTVASSSGSPTVVNLDSDVASRIAAKGICKAWINFDGFNANASVNLVGVRDQHNVSSLQDHAAGDYTVTFATQLNDNNYCISISASSNRGTSPPAYFGGNHASSQSAGYSYGTWSSHENLAIEKTHIRFQISYPINASLYDCNVVCVAIFGA